MRKPVDPEPTDYRSQETLLQKEIKRFMRIAYLVTLPLAIGSFCFARAFIALEIFLSLRNLPRGSYDTVTWADYIPHL